MFELPKQLFTQRVQVSFVLCLHLSDLLCGVAELQEGLVLADPNLALEQCGLHCLSFATWCNLSPEGTEHRGLRNNHPSSCEHQDHRILPGVEIGRASW